MTLNTSKRNHLTPLRFKRLELGSGMLAVSVFEINERPMTGLVLISNPAVCFTAETDTEGPDKFENK